MAISAKTDDRSSNGRLHVLEDPAFKSRMKDLPAELISQIISEVMQEYYFPIRGKQTTHRELYKVGTQNMEPLGLKLADFRGIFYRNNWFMLDDRDSNVRGTDTERNTMMSKTWSDWLKAVEEEDSVEHIRHLIFYFNRGRILIDVVIERGGDVRLQSQVNVMARNMKRPEYAVIWNAKKMLSELEGRLNQGLRRIEQEVSGKLVIRDFKAIQQLVLSTFAQALRGLPHDWDD